METPITVLERHFDLELSPESLRALSELPYDRWHDFAFEYKRYAEGFYDLNKGQLKQGDGELAPYLWESFHYSEDLARGNTFSSRVGASAARGSKETIRAEQLIRSLKRLLLYHHRVFIPDWLIYLLDFLRFPAGEEADRSFDLAQVLNYVGVLAEIKPLFDAGTVNLIPSEAIWQPHLGRNRPYSYFADEEARQLLRSCLSELNIPPDQEIYAQDRIEKLVDYQIVASELGTDMIFPRTMDERLFAEAVMKLVKDSDSPDTPPIHLLERLPMPRLDDVSLKDLVLLRRDDEKFGEWRDELEQIYLQAQHAQHLIEERPDEFRREVAARLRTKQRAIMRGVEENGGFCQRVRTGTFTLGTGLLGTVAAETLIPGSSLIAQLLGGFLGGAIPLATESLGHVSDARMRQARVRVYSVFDAQKA